MPNEVIFRLIFVFVFLCTISVSSYYRKRARDEGGVIARKAEGNLVLALRMIFAFPLLISFLVYIFYPVGLSWSFIALPAVVRWLFAGVAMLIVPMMYAVFRNIGKNISETVLTKEDHELVTTGPYQWVRHPLYAGSLLLILSFAIISTSWFILAYFLIGVPVFRFIVIPQEEKRLIEAFGGKYIKYEEKTGALFPKII